MCMCLIVCCASLITCMEIGKEIRQSNHWWKSDDLLTSQCHTANKSNKRKVEASESLKELLNLLTMSNKQSGWDKATDAVSNKFPRRQAYPGNSGDRSLGRTLAWFCTHNAIWWIWDRLSSDVAKTWIQEINPYYILQLIINIRPVGISILQKFETIDK